MTPAVSILLPVFNAAPTLGLCLRSIARQTIGDFEALVVDDGSADATVTIAREFADRDPRFRIIERPHEGLVATLNAGVALARGDVVARMDGDDIMHRDRLAAQLQALDADPALDAVGCHVRLFPRSHTTDGLRAYERWLNSLATCEDVRRDAFVECPIAHPTLTIRRRVLREHGYRDMGWPEDYDLVMRLLHGGHRLGVVPRRLHLWRDAPERLSRTDERYAVHAFTMCRAHFLQQSFLSGDRYMLWGFGHTGKALRRALAKAGKSLAAIVDLHPGRIGQKIHGAPVIRPEALPGHASVPLVVSVAGATARAEIRAALTAMCFVELRDYICCA